MPSFDKGPGLRTPFGPNQWLRSTIGLRHESATLAHRSVPDETIDGDTHKMVKRGEVMAKITAAAGDVLAEDVGKVGPFQAGVTDGRQTLANIVGVNDTFAPWQLLHRDIEIAVVYVGTGVQARCTERNAAGARITLTNTTADALRGTKGLDVTFK